MKTGLENLLSPKNSKRLSISDIQRLWNAELHQKEGHKRFQLKSITLPSVRIPDTESDMQQLSNAIMDLSKFGSWVDTKEEETPDSDIQGQLINFIKKGMLSVYESQDSSVTACTPEDLKGVNLLRKSTAYFIDRDDMGCLLVGHGQLLPSFWYSPTDETVFQDQLKRQAEGRRSETLHREELIKENEELNKQLLNARPFMDPEHPLFSEELEAAVTVWLAHYVDKDANDHAIATKNNLKNWLEKNRPGIVQNEDGSLIPRVIERIAGIANPFKHGGRPRKNNQN